MMNIVRAFALLVGLALPIGVVSAQQMTPDEVALLFKELASPDPEIKSEASRRLGGFSEWWIQQDVDEMRNYLPVALHGLRSSDAAVRVPASGFFAIVAMLRPHVADRIFQGLIEEIIGYFDDPHERVRRNMVGSIAMMQPAPPQEAVEPLMDLIRKAPSRVPGELWLAGVAAAGLSRAAPDSREVAEAIAALIEEIPIDEGRRVVIQRLREARPQHPLIIEKLIVQLDEDDRLLRWDAAMALGDIGPAAGDAVAKLRSIAENPDTDDDLRIIVEGALRAIENNSPNRPE